MPPPPASLDLANLPDADVVRLAQDGREAAYRELVRRYERPVFSLVYRMVRDREAAEDLAQESFIKVLNHIDKYDPAFKFSSWLFKIANNVAIDFLRRKKLDTVSIDGSPYARTQAEAEASQIDVSVQQESALDELEARELGTAIERAIARSGRVPQLHHAAARRGALVRGDRRHPRPAARHRQDVHPPRAPRAAARPGAPAHRMTRVAPTLRNSTEPRTPAARSCPVVARRHAPCARRETGHSPRA
jgi:RNA polymerase sigma-70 factor (ECF subfamily)